MADDKTKTAAAAAVMGAAVCIGGALNSIGLLFFSEQLWLKYSLMVAGIVVIFGALIWSLASVKKAKS